MRETLRRKEETLRWCRQRRDSFAATVRNTESEPREVGPGDAAARSMLLSVGGSIIKVVATLIWVVFYLAFTAAFVGSTALSFAFAFGSPHPAGAVRIFMVIWGLSSAAVAVHLVYGFGGWLVTAVKTGDWTVPEELHLDDE